MNKKLFTALSSFLLLAACTNKAVIEPAGENFDISLQSVSRDISIETNQLWHATNKRIIIFYGYNFNSPDFVSSTTSYLSEFFGNCDDNGLIDTIVFPDDFKHGQRSVAGDFKNLLETREDDLAGIVILGAPERTHRALAQLQDSYNGQLPFPVISLFTQDDVLGVEDTSNIVIDRVQNENSAMEETEITVNVEDAEELIKKAVEFILKLDDPITEKESLGKYAALLFPGIKMRRYADSETGIPSVNHFVME